MCETAPVDFPQNINFSKWQTNLQASSKNFAAIYIHYVSNLQWVIFKNILPCNPRL